MTKRPRNALALVLALLLASFAAQAGFRWHKDGSVSVDGQRTPTLLWHIDIGLETPEGVFLAGDYTAPDRPVIAFVPKGGGSVRYWFFPFPYHMLDFFRFQGRLYTYSHDGTVYEHTQDDWVPADMQFESSSVILRPEAGEDVIVCHPGARAVPLGPGRRL